MSKKAKIWIIVAVSIVAILGSTLLVYYFGANYPVYNNMAKKEFKIPGLNDGFVPQGMCYVEENNVWLVSGYMGKQNENSRIYMVNNETGEQQKYFTISSGHHLAKGHFSGIAYAGNIVWLATDKYVLKLNLTDIVNVQNNGEVNVEAEFDTKTGADFIYTDGNFIWVGDFYRDGKFNTAPSHYVKISSTETNYALALKFKINSLTEIGFDAIPILALSLPNQVQGFAQTATGEIILSTSYSIPDSIIYIFGQGKTLQSKQTVSIEFGEIPLVVYHNDNLIKKIKAPAMSEGLDLVDDRIYILFESACNKYKLVNRTRTLDVYSLATEDLLKAI